MAAPVYKNFVQAVAGAGGAVVAPADTAVGDLVVHFLFSQGTAVPTHTLQPGYSLIRNQGLSDSTTCGRLSVTCRVATVAGAQTYTPYSVSGHTGLVAGLITVTGADTYGVQPESWVSNSGIDTTATAPNPPAVTPLTGDYLVLAIAGWQVTTAGTTSATVMASYTLRINGPTGSHVSHLAVASREMTGLSAATEDPATYTDNVTPNGSAAMTIAIPASTGAGPIDLFDRTDAISFGGNWVALDRTMNIVSNAASPLQLNWCSAYWTGTVLTDNQYSEVTVGSLSGGSGVGPMVRMQANFTYYYLYADGSFIYLQKIVAGSASVTIATITQTVVAGDVIRLEVEGSSLRSYHNTVLKDTSIDTAITTGFAGLFCFPSGALANATISSWKGGILGLLNGNLTGYWNLDEASGNRVDSTGLGSTEVEANGSVSSASGIVSSAASFVKANNRWLRCPSNSNVSMGNFDFSVSCWIKLTTKAADTIFVGKCGATNGTWQITYKVATDRFVWQTWGLAAYGGYAEAVANALGSPSTGTWYFIVCDHNATADTISVQVNNGTINSAAQTNGTYVEITNDFSMSNGDAAQQIDGLLDEVGLWKRILTTTERTSLYNSGAGLTYPFTGVPPPGQPTMRRWGGVPQLPGGQLVGRTW
jgi:concanavalin A-like lectin/glucanase superfamily protein